MQLLLQPSLVLLLSRILQLRPLDKKVVELAFELCIGNSLSRGFWGEQGPVLTASASALSLLGVRHRGGVIALEVRHIRDIPSVTVISRVIFGVILLIFVVFAAVTPRTVVPSSMLLRG